MRPANAETVVIQLQTNRHKVLARDVLRSRSAQNQFCDSAGGDSHRAVIRAEVDGCAQLRHGREIGNDRHARLAAAVHHRGCSGNDVGIRKNPEAFDPAGEQHIGGGGNLADVRAVCFKQFNAQFRACLSAEFDGRLCVWLRWIPHASDGLDVRGRIMHGAKQDFRRLQRAEARNIGRAR